MSEFNDVGGGWSKRKSVGHLVNSRKMKKENKELKEQLQTLAERLEKLEEKVAE